jgi:AraC family cel operon transcriptional repressor
MNAGVMPTFRADAYLGPPGGGRAFHLARLAPQRRRGPMHCQDFPELLVVARGAVMHRLPGGVERLGEGTALFVRAGDVHGVGAAREGAEIVNLMFRAAALDALAGWYELAREGRAWWWPGPAPDRAQLGEERLGALLLLLDALQAGPSEGAAGRAARDGLLLSLLSLLAPVPRLPPGLPPWLRQALIALERPEALRAGVPALIRATGRSGPHVARAMRAHLGRTPTAHVARLRMARARRLLLTTALSVETVAIECGLENRSHFHRLFREATGTTPAAWRRARARDPLTGAAMAGPEPMPPGAAAGAPAPGLPNPA